MNDVLAFVLQFARVLARFARSICSLCSFNMLAPIIYPQFGPVSLSFSLLIEHFGHVLIEIIVAFLMTNSIFSLISLFSLS